MGRKGALHYLGRDKPHRVDSVCFSSGLLDKGGKGSIGSLPHRNSMTRCSMFILGCERSVQAHTGFQGFRSELHLLTPQKECGLVFMLSSRCCPVQACHKRVGAGVEWQTEAKTKTSRIEHCVKQAWSEAQSHITSGISRGS